MKTATLSLAVLLCGFSLLQADDDGARLQAELDEAKKRAAAERFTLRYQFAPQEKVRWKVVHLGSTETTIQGNTQTSQSRSESIKVWHVTSVDDKGQITLTHSVEHVRMWQKLSDRPEIRFDSDTDESPPAEYEHVARTVGVPLTSVTISPDGQIIKRESRSPKADLGMGEIVMLLPPKPVKAGSRWYEPGEIRIRLQDGRTKPIKIRKLYTLEKVQTGVATITVATEVLTPISDSRIKSQLVQQLTNGTIKFDVQAGRIVKKQMDWDETVVGFNGADSLMKYQARFTEELLPDEEVAAGPDQPATPPGSTARAKRSDQPALRR